MAGLVATRLRHKISAQMMSARHPLGLRAADLRKPNLSPSVGTPVDFGDPTAGLSLADHCVDAYHPMKLARAPIGGLHFGRVERLCSCCRGPPTSVGNTVAASTVPLVSFAQNSDKIGTAPECEQAELWICVFGLPFSFRRLPVSKEVSLKLGPNFQARLRLTAAGREGCLRISLIFAVAGR